MKNSRRGKNVALIGAAGQIVFAAVMLIAWAWAESAAAMACTLLLVSGAMLWLMVSLLLYCRQLAERERVELSQLADETSASIFAGEGLADQRLAARRLEAVQRWGVPIFTLMWAVVNAAVGYLVLKAVRSAGTPDMLSAAPASLLVIVAGFGAFLFSCYALGMARQLEWRPLRAPASYLLVCVLMIAGTIAALISASQKQTIVDSIVAHAVPIIQLILAAEMIVNFIMERYRPRVAGAESRLSFDSRLMNLVAEPKRVGHSIAEAMNYQFGFEVSHTWFYQLLQRAFVPLLVFSVLLMFAMTAIVPVGQGQSAIITHFGKMNTQPVGPGLHLKWPWPIDTADVFDHHVRTMYLGMGEHRGHHRAEVVSAGTFRGRELHLWTQEHGAHEELNFLVAIEPDQTEGADDTPSVNVIRLTAVLQYRVTDPVKFGYRFADATKMLDCLAHREMVCYCSSATLFEGLPGEDATVRPQAIMTYGQEAMAEELKRRIQRAIDQPHIDLGIEIIALDFRAIHPPPGAAPAFEEVLSARLGQHMQRFEAEAYAARKFIVAAGDPVLAQKLALALRRRDDLTNLLSSQPNGDRAAFARSLEQIIQLIDTHLTVLTRDVARENLLGGAGERASQAQEVLEALREYRDLLERIRLGEEVDLQAMIAQATQDAEDLFSRASGRAAVLMAEAQTDRWQREMRERSRMGTFPAEWAAFKAGGRLYILDRYLDVWDEVLPGMPKYVIGFDPDRLEPWLNLERSHRTAESLVFDRENSDE